MTNAKENQCHLWRLSRKVSGIPPPFFLINLPCPLCLYYGFQIYVFMRFLCVAVCASLHLCFLRLFFGYLSFVLFWFVCLCLFYFIIILSAYLFSKNRQKVCRKGDRARQRFFQLEFLLRPFYVWLEYDLLVIKSCGKLPTSVLGNQGQDAPADLSWPVRWPACANLLVQQTAQISC